LCTRSDTSNAPPRAQETGSAAAMLRLVPPDALMPRKCPLYRRSLTADAPGSRRRLLPRKMAKKGRKRTDPRNIKTCASGFPAAALGWPHRQRRRFSGAERIGHDFTVMLACPVPLENCGIATAVLTAFCEICELCPLVVHSCREHHNPARSRRLPTERPIVQRSSDMPAYLAAPASQVTVSVHPAEEATRSIRQSAKSAFPSSKTRTAPST
jgi:hypothetical protein